MRDYTWNARVFIFELFSLLTLLVKMPNLKRSLMR